MYAILILPHNPIITLTQQKSRSPIHTPSEIPKKALSPMPRLDCVSRNLSLDSLVLLLLFDLE
jgi:hypothetical protein